jgi:acetyltransferase-like isoleucine patch superfamily enzyme
MRLALKDPGKAVRVIVELLRGRWYKLWLPLRGIRFSAGRNFRVSGSLAVRGPGRIVFGDDVTIGMRVTPWTYAAEATIDVGSRVFLNGTRFGCLQRIEIGSDCILGESHVFDTNFHSTSADRHDPTAPVRTAPVTLGANVWVGAQAGLLPGTSVGENSVVGFGAVLSGTYPANVILAGNPARAVGEVTPGRTGRSPSGGR